MGRVGSNLTINYISLQLFFQRPLVFYAGNVRVYFIARVKSVTGEVDSINCFLVTGVDEGEMLFKILPGRLLFQINSTGHKLSFLFTCIINADINIDKGDLSIWKYQP